MGTIGGPDELVDLLRKTPVILRALTGDLSDERARDRSETDGWSVTEVIGHLIDAERRAITRIAHLQAADNPVLEGYDQMEMVERQGYRSQSVGGLVEEFASLRVERVAALEVLDAAGWQRTGVFASHGQATLVDITTHMCWHDANHLAQIALMLE